MFMILHFYEICLMHYDLLLWLMMVHFYTALCYFMIVYVQLYVSFEYCILAIQIKRVKVGIFS